MAKIIRLPCHQQGPKARASPTSQGVGELETLVSNIDQNQHPQLFGREMKKTSQECETALTSQF